MQSRYKSFVKQYDEYLPLMKQSVKDRKATMGDSAATALLQEWLRDEQPKNSKIPYTVQNIANMFE